MRPPSLPLGLGCAKLVTALSVSAPLLGFWPVLNVPVIFAQKISLLGLTGEALRVTTPIICGNLEKFAEIMKISPPDDAGFVLLNP